jgi:cellobiose phosphorylase
MSHPLNSPVYDHVKKRVVEGYSILQPRVVSSLPGEQTSWYAHVFGCDSGIDPYTLAVSDVYQDLFKEGSYIGKGIYDVTVFTQAIAGRLPENRILSHDLLEGAYGRAGLVSDIQLIDEFPGQYCNELKRRHRWIRGDWQIVDWLGMRVPGYMQKSVPNPVSILSKWKIFDNLRRSIISMVYMMIIIISLFFLTPSWTGVVMVVAILLFPVVPGLIVKAVHVPTRYPLVLHGRLIAGSVGIHIFRLLFALAIIPYEAITNFDAILRTVWRVNISRRNLLQWITSKNSGSESDNTLWSYFRLMGAAPLLSGVFAGVLFALGRMCDWPILVFWILSPILSWFVSRPMPVRPSRISAKQLDYLSTLTRKTWRYFETFAGLQDNWLPADNYQEEPREAVAHRTSPTNIGLLLLSNLGAYDTGYLCMGQLIDRTRKTFKSMESLTRFRGHFLNWYDTRTLQPLAPQYVSTVDSGNLAGYLLTLRSGLLGIKNQLIFQQSFFRGLRDTIYVLQDHLVNAQFTPMSPTYKDTEQLRRIHILGVTIKNIESEPYGLNSIFTKIHYLLSCIQEIRKLTQDVPASEISWWFEACEEQCTVQLKDLLFLAPWLVANQLEDILNLDPDAMLDSNISLEQFAELPQVLQKVLAHIDMRDGATERAGVLERQVKQGAHRARERMKQLVTLAEQCRNLAEQEYSFLYDESRKMLAIGYDVTNRRRDDSFYDLLASEARLGSFIGIAQGKLPVEHWFALGRLITIRHGKTILLSWSGSMFEYLMPQLIMPGYKGTLLGQTCNAIVGCQIDYGRERGVPWGISESGENRTDSNLNYQYRSFGIPSLGFKRDLMADLVVAPYAAVLALMVKPEEACANMQRMSKKGYEGRYGLFEAIDFTPTRAAHDHSPAVIKSFMAHHQGMSFISMVNFFTGNVMVRRFESDPLFQATTLLLQERVPKAAPFLFKPLTCLRVPDSFQDAGDQLRIFTTAQTIVPEVHLLSNGRYHVMITNAGGGYSRWHDLAVTRWNEDVTRDNCGSFIYVKDVTRGKYWSAAFQPTCRQPRKYEVVFSQARAEFRRLDEDIETYTEIAVSPEDDIENRRISLRDVGGKARIIELTSFAEIVLAPPATDTAHTVFSNLFVQTEILPEYQAILSTRRPRSPEGKNPWMFHLLVGQGLSSFDISYETDRLAFVGRTLTTKSPAAMETNGPLGGNEKSVLDPIHSIRCRLALVPWGSVTVEFITGVAQSRLEAITFIEKYRDRQIADRVFDMAAIHGKMALQQLNITEADAQLYGRLASSVFYANKYRRASSTTLLKNTRGQSNLWSYSISGDLPIVLLRIANPSRIALVAKLVQAHAYWRLKGLSVDLVIWNEEPSGYQQAFRDEILGLITTSPEALLFGRKAGIFLLHPDQMQQEDRILMQAAARIVISDLGGTLADQIQHAPVGDVTIPKLVTQQATEHKGPEMLHFQQEHLLFFNGWGGFTQDGREYVIQIKPKSPTPMPWVNVLANNKFGTVISPGGGYTWFENSHEFRLTPWYNDPISDQSGEVVYIRDEESGQFWSATPQPAPGMGDYLNRHGFGYSVFEYTQYSLKSELWIYVDTEAPVKFWILKLRNDSSKTRNVSVTGFLELVLGESRSGNQMHIRTGIDSKSGALLVSNPFNTDFAGRVVFFEVNHERRSISGDRTEFLGRNGTLNDPAALHRVRLSGNVGVGLDPAAILQVYLELEPGQEKDIVFFCGVGHDLKDAQNLIQRFQGSQAAYAARDRVWQYWRHTLGAINIETPDTALNLIANGWLIYQTMTARLWGRSGYYQSGGAFGFRDQLQDVMALIHTEPRLVREHLLLCASRQFPEGDVQHWWHPPQGRGVRTLISDDYLWLPFVVIDYVDRIGDTGILDETVHFLQCRLLKPAEESFYDLPSRAHEKDTLYEHCKRAILHALQFGTHGLPLMGSGDWNDGMNLVGVKGMGESVWLAFFLYAILRKFAPLAHLRGDGAFSEKCTDEAKRLRQKIESEAWDGQWYLRAFCDDGTALGSSQSVECKIDAIAQSWSVLSGAGSSERSKCAMRSLAQNLIDSKNGLIKLLDPPFDKSPIEPGYIKGYVPGIRENGGQYTHAAIWAVAAFAMLKDVQQVTELLPMINPVNHGSTQAKIERYMVEPYVMAADIYGSIPHVGRGGWTWYTGSAAWMYRLIIESVLGIQLKVNVLTFDPCVSAEWEHFKVHYRFHETVYHCAFHQKTSGGEIFVTVDGVKQESRSVSLIDDQREHNVEINIGVDMR